jgi:fibro-slime domain-containing protein
MGARGAVLFSLAAVFANCGGKSSLEGDEHAGNAGSGNPSAAAAGNTGGGNEDNGGAGDGGTAAAEGGADAGGAASGGEHNGGNGDSTSGAPSGGGAQVGGAGGQAGGAGGEGQNAGAGGQSETECGTWRLPITFRDFNGRTATGGHPDFAPGVNSPGVVQGLLQPVLDEDGKPVLVAPSVAAFMHGQDVFSQWFRDIPGMNATVEKELVLWNDGDGNYVNRWGANGERWSSPAAYTNITYGGPGGGGCVSCEPSAQAACYDPCVPLDILDACCAELGDATFDGTPLFFPVDDAPNALRETREQAKLPEEYGWVGWPWESHVADSLGIVAAIETAWAPFPSSTHNFNFTSELKFGLRYDAGVTTTVSVEGDDDIWVFVNGRLAVDLGSWHVPLPGSVTIAGGSVTTSAQLDAMTPPTMVTEMRPAADFGLAPGEMFEVAIFHAERQKEGATFRLSLSGVSDSACLAR